MCRIFKALCWWAIIWRATTFWRQYSTDELPAVAAHLEVIDLSALLDKDATTRVGTLPEKTAVIYTGIYYDGDGVSYLPRDALAAVSKAANRPIVTDVDSLIGYGAVGGFVLNNVSFGEAAAQVVLRILDGESAAAIPVALGDVIKPVFDWRELQRWKIVEKRLPPGSEIRFRPSGIWDQYRTQVLITLAIVLFQTALIAWLIIEHRRRQTAELEARRRLAQVEHMNRSAGVGALSAAFAHDLNQPLGAIRSNAEAAEILLGKEKPDLPLVKEILADILRSDQHAAGIVAHLRDLLRKSEVEGQIVDINEAVNLVLELVQPGGSHQERDVEHGARSAAASRTRRLDPVAAGHPQSGLERHGCDAGRRLDQPEAGDPHVDGQRIRRPGRDLGFRARHCGRQVAEYFRAVFHHQAERPGPRLVHRAHDRRTLRRQDLGRKPGRRRRHFPHQPAARRGARRMSDASAVIHVVDDDALFRTAISRLLKASGFQVALYESAQQLLDAPSSGTAGCILLDVQMSGLSGPQLQDRLAERGNRLPIIFVTGHGDIPTSVRTIKAGAQDFLTKPVSRVALLETIRRALERYEELHAQDLRDAARLTLVARLTPREREVFELVVRGKINKQIAHELGTSERTIKAHRHKVMEKCEVKSLAELVIIAERMGALSATNTGGPTTVAKIKAGE